MKNTLTIHPVKYESNKPKQSDALTKASHEAAHILTDKPRLERFIEVLSEMEAHLNQGLDMPSAAAHALSLCSVVLEQFTENTTMKLGKTRKTNIHFP